LTLGALLRARTQWWPHLVVGSWLGDFAAELSMSGVADSLVFAALNAAQTLMCAIILRWYQVYPVTNPRHYLVFIVCYVGLVAPVGATLAILYLPPLAGEFWPAWRSWWLGDGLYVMTLTPLVLAWNRCESPKLRDRSWEVALVVGALTAAYAFDSRLAFTGETMLFNVSLPPLLWVALRFGVVWAAAATTMLTAAAGLATLVQGSAVSGMASDHLLRVQMLLFGDAASSLFLAIVAENWRRAQRERDRAFGQTSQALDAAERANLAKSRFLAAASHDLRQPYQAMALFRDILVMQLTEAPYQKALDGLSTAMAAGQELLDTLLHISALEAGTTTPNIAPIQLNEILAGQVEEFRDVAAGQGLSLRYVPCTATIHSDPVLLGRMIRNLLTNALKYTKEGRILLGCRREGDSIRVEVWDTGPGVPPEKQAEIWDEFVQLDNPNRDRSRGLGLGLSIVARTGQLLGHPVGLRSWLGKGSVFFVTCRTR
ncbi:MAG TPA: ATP-binding protein, partial [Magnetospirillum sp.]|nr:ATP-binding protein [Magnetospirillum sp.]